MTGCGSWGTGHEHLFSDCVAQSGCVIIVLELLHDLGDARGSLNDYWPRRALGFIAPEQPSSHVLNSLTDPIILTNILQKS